MSGSVLNPWVQDIPMMQQTVLLSAIRGPDGMAKGHPAKELIRWYRRCVLLSAFDKRELLTPWEIGGGAFAGPSTHSLEWAMQRYKVEEAAVRHLWEEMEPVVDNFLRTRDELTLHYYAHFMHAAEVLAFKHPVEATSWFWRKVYARMCGTLHLRPESRPEMDERLGDDIDGWKKSEDRAGSCQT